MDLRGHLDLLLLAALDRLGPAHGYALIAAIRRTSAGVFDLAEGTVYPALHRLEGGGAIAGTTASGPTGRPRRVYRLTHAGEALLADHRRAWRTFAAGLDAVVGR